MQIFLDDQPYQAEAGTVGEAIAACSATAEESGRCLVEVIVDGQSLSNDELGEADLTRATAEEVRLVSAKPAELVGQTLADASGALDDLRTIQDDAAASFQADDHDAAMEHLREAFTIWMSVQQAVVQGPQLVGLDLDRCTVNDQPVTEIVAALGEQLEAMRSQLERNDLVGVADTLLYDLPPVIDQWREMIDTLQEIIEKAEHP